MIHFIRFTRPWTSFRIFNSRLFSRHGANSKLYPMTRLLLPSALLVGSFKHTILNEELEPDPSGDTFEMGLYYASQRELLRDVESQRLRNLRKCRSIISRMLFRTWYKFKDSVLEPILTVFRFLELSALFVPVLLLYPIVYFGHKVNIRNMTSSTKDAYGALVWYRLLRSALEIAGPSFIKLGQWAGSRTDMFSEGLCIELGKLHSNAKKHSLKYTQNEVCESLQIGSLDEAFEEFKEEPLGVGAIAQVHVGKLSPEFLRKRNLELESGGNRWCAVKVIHPHASRNISRDLKIMKFFADTIDMIPTMEWLSLPNEVEQFTILMRLQLDLRIECLNLTRFNQNFKGQPQVKFPKGFQELTSRKVLFEEYVNGLPMEDFLRSKDQIGDVNLCKKVSDTFIDAFLQMLISDDFIHADLHPGNVMIRFIETDRYGSKQTLSEEDCTQIVRDLKEKMSKDKDSFAQDLRDTLTRYTPQLCFIDTGLVTELNSRNRTNFIALFDALARFDGYRAGELMIERSRTPETAVDKDLFALKVEKLVKKVKKRTFTLGTVSIGDLLDQMLGMVRGHHVRMEGDFVSVIVAILLLEGIGRQLDPDLDLFASSLPILRELSMKREGRSILQDVETLSMIKIWLGLEIRQLMSLSVKQMRYLVKTDQLCSNY
ncbi:LAMI_0E08482g1_1 [Lachancea mirantina]|uniref:LAMI_0E08482g1_1 n=1 Tax=Lachancea mirantina TaxID=1230905 RepID=A0A1G4JN07_9SACH|nr:LAMI_0E08482g1_1 [Lachancea mirantina]